MKETAQLKQCPKCGGVELGRGKHSGMGSVYPYGKMGLTSEVEILLCTDCGFIIESYVTKPKRFKGTIY